MSALLAAWAFICSPIGRLVAVGGLMLAIGFSQGWSIKARFDRSATLRAVVDKQRVDLQAAQDTAEQANAALAEMAKTDQTNQETIRDLQTALAKAPQSAGCSLMTLLLAGCAGSGSALKEVVRRDLPVAPGYLQAVAVPEPAAGESLVAVAARERAGRLKANAIIRNARAQWDKLRRTYKRAR